MIASQNRRLSDLSFTSERRSVPPALYLAGAEKMARHSCVSPKVLTNVLQRAQEVQDVLLLGHGKVVEIGLCRVGFGPRAVVGFDRSIQVFGAAVVQEEDPLSQAPQGSRAELVSTRATLGDVVVQRRTHVMDLQVAEQIGSGAAQAGRQRRWGRLQ